MKNKFYSLEKVSETEANLYIYGDIVSYKWDESDVTLNDLKNQLESFEDLSIINVHINSYGGDTFQGLAIYNLLKQHKAIVNIYVDGIAASSASIIAMAGDKIYMPKTSLMMIHNCWTYVIGNAEELRKVAGDMDKIAEAYKSAYMSRINITNEKLEQLLADETYLTANECVEMGFADEILEDEKMAVNSFANKSILNLVERLKIAEKKQSTEKVIDKKIIDELVEKISNNLTKHSNSEKKDSWESFFNIKK